MKNLQVYKPLPTATCVRTRVALEYKKQKVGEIMRALIDSCRNMRGLFCGALATGSGQVITFYWHIARGKKSVLSTSLGLVGLYLTINWLIIGVCELLWLFNIEVVLKKNTFFMLLAPFFVFACYCAWKLASTMENKILKLIIKAATIGYLYITLGSFVVSTGVFKWTESIDSMNTVIYPLKVEKSESARPLDRFENSLY